jgi:hypothetical protein
MSRIEYPRSSPYYGTAQTSWLLGRYKHRTIAPHKDDSFVEILPKHALRPDRLSQELYGTPVYWWVFMVCNTSLIRDPIWDLKVGMIIRAPSANRLRMVIG